MKFLRQNFWIVVAIFTVLSAIFVVFTVKKKPPKNNISASELKEAKKQVNIRILRYEEDLFSLDMNNLQKGVAALSKKYPSFLVDPDIWQEPQFKAYLQDTVIIALQKTAEKAVKTNILLKELETAFGYYKVFYPNNIIPEIITILPGLDELVPTVYIYNDILFINVDMYLGADNPYYSAARIPMYIAERYDPVYLPVDIFKKAIVHKHLARVPHHTLLDAMITEGKKLYFTEMMLPALPERYIIGYSEEKYNWATQYLGNAWSYLIEKNELFGKGETLTRCYIEEAPFTKPFGNESPGRMGTFLGWKLIQSYMANHPNITLPELMQEIDYQKILSSSKFKPQGR
ncbi:MAG: hypothetical protein FWD09_01355 [Lentimicrobiaceae bacterium]|nr:hypothetical protein [Lentimicrobiaceae bacterium]